METINSEEKIKKQFEKERMMFIGEQVRAVNQSEFLEILIKNWRTK